MKRLALIAIACGFLAFTIETPGTSATEKDRELVKRAAQDYVEALYDAKPELIDRSVHPALEKLGTSQRDGTYRTPGKMTFEQLRELAAGWNRDGRQGKDMKFEITVLDLLDVTASVKLEAKWGYDYMHLIKRNGTWKIVQIIWQSHPPKKQ